MLKGGRWEATAAGDGKTAGFALNELYSPWVKFADLALNFLEAKKSRETLQTFINTSLGQVWEESGDRPSWELLKNRAETYELMTVPAAGLLLTAGIDVQDNRLAIIVKAWSGRQMESWLILWAEIYGDPSQPQVWQDLDQLLDRDYQHASGRTLKIVSAAIDSGGHHTQTVYDYVRQRQQADALSGRHPRLIAIKGMSTKNKAILGRPTTQDINIRGEKIPGGIQLWPVGSDTAKSTIYGRLKITTPGPGYFHFPAGLPDDYYKQLTSEKLVTRFKKGFPVEEWQKIGHRNEALDCEVYALAAAIRAGIERIEPAQLSQAAGVTAPPRQKKKKQPAANPYLRGRARW